MKIINSWILVLLGLSLLGPILSEANPLWLEFDDPNPPGLVTDYIVHQHVVVVTDLGRTNAAGIWMYYTNVITTELCRFPARTNRCELQGLPAGQFFLSVTALSKSNYTSEYSEFLSLNQAPIRAPKNLNTVD